MAARDDAGGGTGSVCRRRERGLRSHLRHERMAVVMALAESTHHSAQRQKTARAGGEARDAQHGHVPEAPLPQGGSRPPCLGEPRGPQVAILRHALEHMADICPFVQIIDAPVPQKVEQLADFFKGLDSHVRHRSAQDLTRYYPSALCGPRSADGGTVVGCADSPDFFLSPAADSRADRRHSSSCS